MKSEVYIYIHTHMHTQTHTHKGVDESGQYGIKYINVNKQNELVCVSFLNCSSHSILFCINFRCSICFLISVVEKDSQLILMTF